MLSRHKRILWITIFCAYIGLVTVGFGCKKQAPSKEGENVPSSNPTPAVPTAPVVPAPTVTATPTPSIPASPDPTTPILPGAPTETDLDSLILEAQRFAETWGTYASSSNCQNIRELLSKMSSSLRTEMENYINNQCTGNYAGPEFSWQTMALEALILEQGNEYTNLLVVTKRQKGSASQEIYYANLILEYVREFRLPDESVWKVNSVYWAKSQ